MSRQAQLIVHVAVGLICNANDEVLIALRPDDRPLGGYWEFPGGKVEQGEDVIQALKRELHEELGIHVHTVEPFLKTQHRYTKNEVLLDVLRVLEFTGEPSGHEGQEIAWVKIENLSHYKFPEANLKIIQQISSRIL